MLKIIEVEQRAFQQIKASPAKFHNVIEMMVEGSWTGAPTVQIEAFEVEEVGSTTGRMKTQCKKFVARNQIKI